MYDLSFGIEDDSDADCFVLSSMLMLYLLEEVLEAVDAQLTFCELYYNENLSLEVGKEVDHYLQVFPRIQGPWVCFAFYFVFQKSPLILRLCRL